jgi:hypothetical protein
MDLPAKAPYVGTTKLNLGTDASLLYVDAPCGVATKQLESSTGQEAFLEFSLPLAGSSPLRFKLVETDGKHAYGTVTLATKAHGDYYPVAVGWASSKDGSGEIVGVPPGSWYLSANNGPWVAVEQPQKAVVRVVKGQGWGL